MFLKLYKYIYLKKVQTYFIIFVFTSVIAIFFSNKQGYGNDLDIAGLISTFINLIENGIYVSSRYYGHPLGELIIGFLAYFYGAKIVVIFCTLSYISSIILLFQFFKVDIKKNLLTFFILVISNPLLLFNNINPSDFSLALLFFSLGLNFFDKQKIKILCPILFGFAVATRAEFALYVLALFIFTFFDKKKYFNSIVLLIYSGLISALFYLPIFFQHKLTLSFLVNDGGPDISLYQLTPRFIYKLFLIVNPLSILIILFAFLYICIQSKEKIVMTNKEKLIALFISMNLIIFYFMPTKIPILTFSIIIFYLLIYKYFNLKIIYLIIILNLTSWFYTYDIILIKYKDEPLCGRIVAIDANFHFYTKKGYFYQLMNDNEKRIKCYGINPSSADNYIERPKKLIKGERMKLN